MYREEPDNRIDSGWRFFAGTESQEFVDNAENLSLYDVNTIANDDPDIIPLLDSPFGCAFEKEPGSREFAVAEFPSDPDAAEG